MQLQKIPTIAGLSINTREYTICSHYKRKQNILKFESLCCKSLLPSINPSRGFKDKDVLTKRCKDCYFQKIDGRWYVLCNTHPRHKQRQRVDEKSKWIITHSTHGVKKF